jgi:hypothetical protein
VLLVAVVLAGAATADAQCTAPACPAADCFVSDLTGTDGAGCCTALGGCKTIQGGINDAVAGDVIDVAAGTYTEAAPGPLTINKTLTLCGAQDGVDARTRIGVESIIADSQGTQITASNVVVNGFTIQDSTTAAFTGYGLAMGVGTTGTQVLANIIQDNIAGIGLANTGTTQVLICQNLIQNNNEPGGASGTGIYTDEFVCSAGLTTNPCSNFLIEENAFTGHTDSGIFISNTLEANPLTLLDISNNSFNLEARAIGLINTDNSTIHDNSITNSTGAATATIRIFDDVDNLTILNNDLNTGAGYGIRLTDNDFFSPGPNPSSNVVINFNNIVAFGLDGLNVGALAHVGTVDATCNWWNSATGPTNGGNPGGTGEEVVGDADFTPWSIAPNPGGACTGGLPTTTTTLATTTTTLLPTTTTTLVTTTTTLLPTTTTTLVPTTTTLLPTTTTLLPTTTTLLPTTTTTLVTTTTTTSTTILPANHFKCYRIRTDRFQQRNVTLVDQFVTSTATVIRPDRLCNPADKNGEGIDDPTAHLMCYKIREGSFARREVLVRNQFGDQTLTVVKPASLCNPADKDSVPRQSNGNHFKCYRVRGRGFASRTVSVADQFESQMATLVKPRLLCNPVDKNGEGIVDPTAHLTCYTIKGGGPPFTPQDVTVMDQFAEENLQALRGECRKRSLVCVPSEKNPTSPSGAFLEPMGALL